MKISTKGLYAVRVLADIARCDKNIVPLSEISQRQGISLKYLEQIVSKLVKSKLLVGSRGQNGGYALAKTSKEISVGEILDATGDGVKLVACAHKDCPRIEKCDSVGVWFKLSNLINDYIYSVKLADLIENSVNCLKENKSWLLDFFNK